MKVIRGIKLGGLQQKIFNLMLIFIIALIGLYAAVSLYQHKNLTGIVQEASASQQASIEAVSEETMKAILEVSMTQSTALQAYIADDLFGDVRTDVLTLQTFATELFEHAELFSPHPFSPPDPKNDGVASVQMQHEPGVDPASSEDLALVANMSEIMLAMFESSDKLSSCFVATADGCILFVDDRAGSYVTETGEVDEIFRVRERPWYVQAAEEEALIFTGVELDSFTDILGLVCAAPVYRDGALVAVVGADIFLTSVSDYVRDKATEGGFVCVVNEDGQVLFSPQTEGVFKAELSKTAPDLRQNENAAFAAFVNQALQEQAGLTLIEIGGKEYYLTGAPMPTLGWAVFSVVEKEITHQPTAQMLEQYDKINADALASYEQGTRQASRMTIFMTVVLLLLAVTGALFVAGRVVRPLERMTRRINALSGGDRDFEMEDVYRTNDEIEVLAESFASLSKRTREYITQITQITAEKERIGTELALATQIQADMLPNIFPAFPDRPEFDVYASMDPAKEVGGDFYDFFLIDETHLGLVMADVSGKGVPAALFMMIAKTLVQNNAMAGKGPAEVLRAVNDQICANNREEMFVTVWLGILDLSTGLLTCANAGHEYPALKQPGGSFALYKDKHGFVIGGMEGIQYKEYDIQLEPGVKLFLYTDGVPEATNAENELFGTDRMLEALNTAQDKTPEVILKTVRSAVDGFVKDAEQFDDLTMLCLEFKRKDAEG
ncbi:MAG: SpoIIE family protein phosphatase [Oscillospiraceae bacterium]|nr:SpoIIE family protein phosphatase [Oscillospiraceae bacterium]